MRLNADPWRYRCPEGHTDVVERRDERSRGGAAPATRFYCRSCKDGDGDPHCEHVIDAKTGQEVPP